MLSVLLLRYQEKSSEWTLDYPPLFAWFEWLLSQVAVHVDPKMVDLSAHNYAGPACIVVQVHNVTIG